MNSIREGNGTPLQYSCLENPMDGGAWWAAVHGVAKSRTRLSDFTLTFHFHALEKEMATHSSVLAWRIPGMGEPGGLLSMGLHRVGHDWSNLATTIKKKNTKNIQNETKTKWQQQQKTFDRFEEFANRAVEILFKMTNLKQRTTKTCEEIRKYATYIGNKEKHPTENGVPEGLRQL